MGFFKLKSCSLFTFSCIVSIGTLLLYNLPFFNYVAGQTNEGTGGKIFLLVSLVVVMLALNFMLTYLVMFLTRRVGRVLLAILSLINATAVYFIVTYSVMIDATTIENVFNTRYSEASGFFSWSLWLFIVGFGLLPALFCLLQPVVYGKAKKMGIYCGGSLAVALLVALLNIGQTLFITEHDTELGGLVQPWSYIANTCRVISFSYDEQQEEIKLPDGRITDEEKAVVVLVIGESARKANFQLYGYQRDTNPLLGKREDLKVYEATSCATYTTAGTKAILEPVVSDDLHELLPNYAFRTGVDVSWRTSNWGEPPIHIDEYLTNEQVGEQYPGEDACYDGILMKGLRERIASSKKNKVLIVLHTSTSHGPKYADKYPKEFEVFKPVARNVEEGEKNVGMLVNAYDNTIRYTDYLLDSLINMLQGMKEWKSAMFFVSDHGESLGENKMFMHGLPMKLAPKTQYEIPFLVWTSEGFRNYKSQLPAVIDQHYVFHSVLNLLSIQSPAYNSDYDIFERSVGSQVTPQAPDYDNATMWTEVNGDKQGTGADVFYVVSTWEEDWKDKAGHTIHYADVWNPLHREHMATEINKVAAYMAPGNHFYAPYYRHATIEAFMMNNEDSTLQRTRMAMGDVCRAFDHFVAHRDKTRPLIIAGFSQGGMAVVELLKHMSDETYRQLAAAYVMGYKVTPEDTLQCKRIKAAKGEEDTGVTICYNTVKDVKYVQPVIAATCMGINPVNWRTDATPARLHDTITVTLSPEYHVLVVKGYSGSEYPAYKGFLNVGDIHSCEPWLYSECIRKNMSRRARAWRRKITR